MPALLFGMFIVVPLIELAVIIQVGNLVGTWPTIAALLVISVAGAALVKREGLRAWSRFREALGAGRLPAEEVTDGALVLLAGALLLTPGFVTDGVGLLCLLPPTRAVINRGLRNRVRRSMGFGRGRPSRFGGVAEDDVEVDVLDVRRTDQSASGDADELDPGAP